MAGMMRALARKLQGFFFFTDIRATAIFRGKQCHCGIVFTRISSLARHIRKHTEEPHHPCPICVHYQGSGAFSRRDHLLQHIRHVHRDVEVLMEWASQGRTARSNVPLPLAELEPHENRPLSAQEQAPTSPVSQHEVPPFPCPMFGCMRVGDYGYLRQMDLEEHLMLFHGVQAGYNMEHAQSVFMTPMLLDNSLGPVDGYQQIFGQFGLSQPGELGTFTGESRQDDSMTQWPYLGFQMEDEFDLNRVSEGMNFDGMYFNGN
ncbi:hypothetical protein GGR57DRAFT_479934 [Xylariaceae sp. FL1272]|nr:hypothetical protein GGR57DRAFT_479934 [Xylariaceae sp. FL1272]